MCGGVVVTDIVTETVLDLADPSLTSSSVLAAVEGMSAGTCWQMSLIYHTTSGGS